MSNNTNTFWGLLNSHKITIPKIQRDYAYGRKDEKASEVKLGLLSSIEKKLSEKQSDTPLTLDFIYGNLTTVNAVIPIDGQQRLTTLFLLHFFAAKQLEVGQDLVLRTLLKFTYETRHSASQFCKSLITDFKIDINNEKLISAQIINEAKYLNTYDNDPSIASMLEVLDSIRLIFKNTANLWNKLTVENRITFYYINLKEYSLTDDLYIKMNSRGKSLTKYEIFKSNFEEYLEEKFIDHKERISTKLDVEWTNLLWNEDCEIDTGLLELFKNIFIIFEYEKYDQIVQIKDVQHWFEDVLKDEHTLLKFEEFIDVFVLLSKSQSCKISDFYGKYFYTSDLAKGEECKVRLFYTGKENLFFSATRNQLGWSELVLFYTTHHCLLNKIDDDKTAYYVRIIRNLLLNSTFELRPQNIHAMLAEVRMLVCNGILPSAAFNSNQLDEEKLKHEFINNNQLLFFENHNILRGSVGLFLKTYPNDYLQLLHKFNQIFNNDYKENTALLRKLFLSYGDYSQLDTDPRKRLFVHKPDAWNSFFTVNTRRRHQEKIIYILNQMSIVNYSEIPKIIEEYLTLTDFTDWRYYFIKYDSQLHYGETQGYFYWSDYENKPLQIIMLNSSVESISNLEWNIFNWILYDNNRDISTLDNHGASKLILFNKNLSINAVQTGYKIEALTEGNNLLAGIFASFDDLHENVITSDGSTDFIVCGQNLINRISTVNHVNDFDKADTQTI